MSDHQSQPSQEQEQPQAQNAIEALRELYAKTTSGQWGITDVYCPQYLRPVDRENPPAILQMYSVEARQAAIEADEPVPLSISYADLYQEQLDNLEFLVQVHNLFPQLIDQLTSAYEDGYGDALEETNVMVKDLQSEVASLKEEIERLKQQIDSTKGS